MRKIGFVIVNYNDAKTTIRLLNQLKEFKNIDSIVVVDNNSTDDSFVQLKEQENGNITIIKNSENKGYASGMNTGAKYLIEKIGKCNIIFSNSDIIIKNAKDLNTLSSNINSEIAVASPVIEEHGNLNRGWKKTTSFTESLLNLPYISRYFKKKKLYYKNEHYQKDKSYVDVVSGCFFMVDSEALEQVDYFDENTFLYYEELIFAKKLEKAGKKLIVDNRVKVIHDHSVTIDKNIKRINKYKILKASQRYYVKNYLKGNLLEMALLYITNKLSLIILYIRCLGRR